MSKFLQWYDSLIFEEYKIDVESLAMFRILYAGLGLLFFGYSDITWLHQIPDFFYRPQHFNIAHFLSDQMPPLWVLSLLSWLPALMLTALLFGYKSKMVAIAFGVLIILANAFNFSLGKIDHGILYPLTAIIMAFSGWGNKHSLDALNKKTPQQAPNGLAPFILALAIGFGFFTAGFAKLNGGWLSPDRIGVLHHYFGSIELWGRDDLLAPLLQDVRNTSLWKSLDYLTVAFELCFLPAVFNKRFFQSYIILAVVFHTITLLVLNITFRSVFMPYGLFLPWQKILDHLKANFQQLHLIKQQINKQNFVVTLILVGVLYAVFLAFSTGENLLAVINMVQKPFWEMDYKMFVVISLYSGVWLFLIWHFSTYVHFKASKAKPSLR